MIKIEMRASMKYSIGGLIHAQRSNTRKIFRLVSRSSEARVEGLVE
jgi:hypothetical protein